MSIDAFLDTAELLAESARPIALNYFRSDKLGVEGKGVGAFDPVTQADREIEAAMREILSRTRPGDGVLGEEHEDTPSSTGVTWVLDPIDGTRAFLCGLPSWGVLIACNDGNRPVIGVMDQPFTSERFIGLNAEGRREAYVIDSRGKRPLKTRSTRDISDALVCSTALEVFQTPAEIKAFETVQSTARMVRMGTDCYGYAVLAMGQIDMVFEAGLKPYDIQALIPIVEGAGGIVTDWQGGDPQNGGQVLASANEHLHEQGLALISGLV